MEVCKGEELENGQDSKKTEKQTGRLYKSLKFLCFLVYAFCIYQSHVFSIAIVELVIKWDRLSQGLVKEGLKVFFIVPLIIIQIILHPGWYLSLLPFLAVYWGIFWLWWRHQAIYTDRIVALTGQIASPGVLLSITACLE